jgi:hypothetical protein
MNTVIVIIGLLAMRSPQQCVSAAILYESGLDRRRALNIAPAATTKSAAEIVSAA